jgi:hypothetical protein
MSDSNNPSRRELVKSIGATSTFAILGATSVTADSGPNSEKEAEAMNRLKAEYSTVGDVMRVMRSQGDELLQALADHDVLDSASTEQLRPGSLLSTSAYRDGAEGVHVSALYEDGTATARIGIRKRTPEHVVKLYFHPQLSDEYAIVESRGERDDVTMYDGGGSVMGHCDYVGDYCSFYAHWCTCNLEKYEVYACGTDCQKGDYLGCCCDGESTPC